MISFSENHEGDLVSFEDGSPLASLRDPRGEALKWVYSLGLPDTQRVVVVGLGAGFHVAALADVDPNLKITVVDTRESLISVFRSQFADIADRVEIVIAHSENELLSSAAFEEVQKDRAYVISFRECWSQQGELLARYFAHLTGRSFESARFHLNEMKINMKALYLQENQLVSIKDVMPIVEAASVDERVKQNFRVLNELVK